jgi:hypothetical protein
MQSIYNVMRSIVSTPLEVQVMFDDERISVMIGKVQSNCHIEFTPSLLLQSKRGL